jgi:tripartite-type tricarboxylate transporter receptor subunit TctC
MLSRSIRIETNAKTGRMRTWCAILLVSTLLVLVAAAAHAQFAPTAAQPYPNRAVRIIVPFGPGGPGDLIARLLAQKLSEDLGQQFYVENHAGGGGNIGTALVARTPADGYTILLTSSTFMINASLYPNLSYDPIKDFQPITIAATTPNVLVVHPSVPAKTVQELVDLFRSRTYTNIAQPGTGTPPHMSAELFKLSSKLDLVMVPFGGGGPMIQSIIAGHTPIGFSALPPAAAQIKQGALRALAVTTATRFGLLTDVPTFDEAGIAGQTVDTPQGILVPAGTPRPIVDLLYREISGIVQRPDIKQKLQAIGFEPVVMTPEEFSARIKTDISKWEKVVQDAKLKPE